MSYDAAHGVYLVSNVNGNPGTKENKGFISRITAEGKLDSLHFIQGGRNGVELNGPLGSRIRGDTLWVLDVDALRAFDTRTGAPMTSIDLSSFHPQLLNDLTFMPNGDIYVTDTGWLDSATAPRAPTLFRIYRVTPDRKVSVAARGTAARGTRRDRLGPAPASRGAGTARREGDADVEARPAGAGQPDPGTGRPTMDSRSRQTAGCC